MMWEQTVVSARRELMTFSLRELRLVVTCPDCATQVTVDMQRVIFDPHACSVCEHQWGFQREMAEFQQAYGALLTKFDGVVSLQAG